jgi:hypothetical protein
MRGPMSCVAPVIGTRVVFFLGILLGATCSPAAIDTAGNLEDQQCNPELVEPMSGSSAASVHRVAVRTIVGFVSCTQERLRL